MEYMYAALLLHKAGQTIDEANVKKVLEAASVKVDEGRVKALIAALENVNIEEALEKASQVQAAPVASTAAASGDEPKKEEKKEEKKEDTVSEDQAAAGLGSLFG